MTVQQLAHLTFKGNRGVARHGWLRLTPAYGVRLVDKELQHHPDARRVLDPFSGTGTTALCATTSGRHGHAVDLNPFLVWLATVKTREYTDKDAAAALTLSARVVTGALDRWTDAGLWEPPLSNIERWWTPSALAALRALRSALDEHHESDAAGDLLSVAFAQTVIESSAAAFNHQSMSFSDHGEDGEAPKLDEVHAVIAGFQRRALSIVEECEPNPPGSASIHLGDARRLADVVPDPIDLLVTSPPYCNRMSYIRELRPYMYWLRFLDTAKAAGELDWQAIGGTWGMATSRLLTHELGAAPVLGSDFAETVDAIANTPNEKHAKLLSNYVFKYFADTWLHVRSAAEVMADGGEVVYIVGNSTFFGHVVPTEKWYADLLRAVGFDGVSVETIRKRNSNKLLFEYAVRGRKPKGQLRLSM
jgi:hypothetical protein